MKKAFKIFTTALAITLALAFTVTAAPSTELQFENANVIESVVQTDTTEGVSVGGFLASKKPAKVKKVTVKANKKSITVKWSKSKKATKYYLYKKVKGGKWKLVKKTKKLKYTDKKVKDGKTYYYKVVAVKGKYKSKASSAKKITKTHNYGAWEVYKEATATTNKQEVKTCKNCGSKTYRTIEKTKVAVPSAVRGLVYNGEKQTGVAEAEGYTVTNGEKINAGTYRAEANLTSYDYIWADGTSTSKVICWSIYKAKLTATVDAKIPYTGEVPKVTATVTGFVGGDTEETALNYTAPKVTNTYSEIGTYELTPKGGSATNYSFYNKQGTLTITQGIIEVPEAVEGLVYNGEEQTGVEASEYYSVKGNTATDAGEYTATVTITNPNYTWEDGTTEPKEVSWSIGKATLYAMADNTTVNYSGEAPEVKVTVTGFEGSDTAENAKGYKAPTVNNENINAGSYLVTPENGEAANYDFEYFQGSLRILKVDYDMTDVKFENLSCTYDGNAHSLMVNGAPDGVTVEYDGNSKTNAGEYTVTAKFTADQNHNDPADITATLTINKKQIAIPTKVDKLLYYNGSEQTGVEEGEGYTLTGNKATNAGSYEAIVTLDSNHEWTDGTTGRRTVYWEIKKNQQTGPLKVVCSATSVAVGQSIKLSTTGGSGNGKVTYEVISTGQTQAKVIGNTLTGVYGDGGTITVKATKAADSNYEALVGVESDSIKITAAQTGPGEIYIYKTDDVQEESKIIQNYFVTEEDQTAANEGANIYVNVETDDVTSSVDRDLKYSFEDWAGEYINGAAKIKGLFETDITKQVINFAKSEYGEVQNYYDLGDKTLSFKIPLTGDMINTNPDVERTYYVVSGQMDDEGNITYKQIENATYNSEEQTIEFESSVFPYFAICCVDITIVQIPEAKTNLIYTGSKQTGVPEGENYYFSRDSVESATDAGTYQVTAYLSDYNSKVKTQKWSDGTTEPKTITWTINPRTLNIYYVAHDKTYDGTADVDIDVDMTATSHKGDYIIGATSNEKFIYSGKAEGYFSTLNTTDADPTVSYNSRGNVTYKSVTITSNVEITPVEGTAKLSNYTIKFEKESYATINPLVGTLEALNVKLEDKTVAYNGKEQSIEAEMPDYITAEYEGSGTNIGTYDISATFTADGKNCIISGDNTLKATLTIEQASLKYAKITLEDNAYVLDTEREDKCLAQIKSVKVGDNELVKDTDYTVSYTDYSGNPITEITENGKYKVVVTGIGNYSGTREEVFYVGWMYEDVEWSEVAACANEISLLANSDTDTLNAATDRFGFTVDGKLTGECKEVRTDEGTLIGKVRILGFNQDELENGAKAGISFEFANIIGKQKMNDTDINTDGWEGSAMRSYLNGTLFKNLPEDLQSVIKPVKKSTNNVGKTADASSVTETSDKLWLLSGAEVYGTGGPSFDKDNAKIYDAEGSQYAYYEQRGVTTSCDVKTLMDVVFKNGSGTSSWWLRSADASEEDSFSRVDATGDWTSKEATFDEGEGLGVSPGFCLGDPLDGETDWTKMNWYQIKLVANKISQAETDEDAIAIAKTYGMADENGLLQGSHSLTISSKNSSGKTNSENCTVIIVGLNHDTLADGSGKAGITFQCITTNIWSKVIGNGNGETKMNGGSTNKGGWEASLLRQNLNKLILSLDGAEPVAVLKETNNQGSDQNLTDKDTAVTKTTDKIWLPSLVEMVGTEKRQYNVDDTDMKMYSREGTQYKRYVDGNWPKEYYYNSGTTWWLRSPWVHVYKEGEGRTDLNGTLFGIFSNVATLGNHVSNSNSNCDFMFAL